MEEEENTAPDPTSREYRLNDFEDNMIVVSYSSWFVIGCFAFFVLLFGVWAIFGSISQQVKANGIAITTEGVLGLPSKVEGRVLELSVAPGDMVHEGAVIATIFDLNHEVETKNAKMKLENLEKDFLEARSIQQGELERRVDTLESDLAATQYEIKERIDNLPDIKKDLESKKRLYKEGLISAILLQSAEEELMEEEITIKNLQVEIQKIQEQILQSYKSDELKNYKRLYYEALNEVSQLEAKSSFFQINSPFDGKILEVPVRIGEDIKQGQSIVLMEKAQDDTTEYVFYSYSDSREGSKVKIGDKAYLELAIVDPQKYGYLEGTVISVSQYPVSDSRIYSVVHLSELVKYLKSSNEAVVEIIVKPKQDSDTPSGYHWTSGRGPDIQLVTGLLASIRVTVESRRPITYLFPGWWVPENVTEDKESENLRTRGLQGGTPLKDKNLNTGEPKDINK